MNNNTLYKRSQLPANSLLVGIDPHKKQHTICITDAAQRVLTKFKIATSRAGFEELVRRSEQWREQHGAATLVFGIEPGGHYWRTLAAYLRQQGYTVHLINPFTLKRQRDGDDLTHRKNDYRDATKAAELLAEGKYTWTAIPSGNYAALKCAYDTYQQLVTERARAKLHLTCALDQLFPEFQTVFKDLAGQTALTILTEQAAPQAIAAQAPDTWLATLRAAHRQQGRRSFQAQKVRRLHALAATSIGLCEGAAALAQQVRWLAQRLAFVQTQVEHAAAYVRQCFEQCPESRFLRSIFGLGVLNAAGLLAHIGAIDRFSGVKQLTKLAGIQPIEDSSAEQHAGHTPMSKKGRSGLRRVTFQAVLGLLCHNEVFQQYIQRLQQRTTHPLKKREALGAAMNKLLRIVYTLLKRQECFDPQKALGV